MYGRMTYEEIDQQHSGTIIRKCIDHSACGCSRCSGYCIYSGHPGYLTAKLMKSHQCLEKKCIYYIPREKKEQRKNIFSDIRISNDIPTEILDMLGRYEGIKVMRTEQKSKNKWALFYIEIAKYAMKVMMTQ